MVLVTGGTGLVGSHLLFKLLSNNETVRAIYRREQTLERVKTVFSYYSEQAQALFENIDWIEADLNDIPALEIAFKGVTHVYHCAAFVSFEPDKYYQLRKINIEGTANIVNLCISNQVKKLCYVSSIAAIGNHLNPDTLITETTAWNPEADNSVYAITKYGAETEVWRGTQEGVPAVIVNPGIILGPGFWNQGGSGSLFKKIYNGLNYYTKGTSGYVDVWDVTAIMIELMTSHIENERYVLISENLSFKDFQDATANALGVKSATKEVTKWLLELGWRLDWLNHKMFGKRRNLSKQLATSLRSKSVYDNRKILKALHYNFNEVDDSIKKVASHFLKDLE